MNPRTARYTALGAALALLLGAGFASCFERQTIDVPTPGSAEALRNPYLALGRLLEAMGHEVRFLEGPGSLDELPPAEATLLLTSSRHTLTARRAEPLLAWVRSGGRLITTVHSTWDREERDADPLIDPLGLFGYRGGCCDEEDREDQEDEEGEDAAAEQPEEDGLLFFERLGQLAGEVDWDVSTARFPGLDRPIEVEFLPSIVWSRPGDVASWLVEGEQGVHLVLLDHGSGRVGALTDDRFARNDRIGERDHAELLARLVGSPRAGAPVWIVISERWPGVLSQIAKHAAPAAISASILLLGWLWRSLRRFGPILPDRPRERRRWMEHLDAVGQFHYQRDTGRRLIAANRAELLRLIRRAHPAWARLSSSERNERIGELCGLAQGEVAAALDGHSVATNEAEVVSSISRLERIRASL